MIERDWQALQWVGTEEIAVVDQDGRWIAEVIMDQNDGGMTVEIQKENASILAAAPDLLKALEAMISSPTYGNEPSEESVEMGVKAIAKARRPIT